MSDRVDSRDMSSADNVVTNSCQSSLIIDAVDLSVRNDNTGNYYHSVNSTSDSGLEVILLPWFVC